MNTPTSPHSYLNKDSLPYSGLNPLPLPLSLRLASDCFHKEQRLDFQVFQHKISLKPGKKVKEMLFELLQLQ